MSVRLPGVRQLRKRGSTDGGGRRQSALHLEVGKRRQGARSGDAIKRAREMGTGVISLRGRMVDAPVVTRAARTIRQGVAFGMLEFDLSDEVIHGEK